jgi:hypothetical protein
MMATENTPFFEDGKRPTLDVTRATRAIYYTVKRLSDDLYEVENRAGSQYTVTLQPLNCDCGDAVYHNAVCKHLIAALWYTGDPEAVELLGEMPDKNLG